MICKLLFVVLTLLVCENAAHEGHHHHPHRFQIPQLPLLFNSTGENPHSHGSGNNPTHQHGTGTHVHGSGGAHSHEASTHTHVSLPSGHLHGPTTHTHPSLIRPTRTRYDISNLWNGSIDTVSQASDKGGNQVVVTLEGIHYITQSRLYCKSNKNVLMSNVFLNICYFIF